MLTIERESPVQKKLVAASAVFVIGFMGSLSMLRVLWPESNQLSSGRQRDSVSKAEKSETDLTGESSDKSEVSRPETATNGETSGGTVSSSDSVVPPIASQPASGYTAPAPTAAQSSTGTVQVSGTMPSATDQTASDSTTTSPLPTSPITAPSLPTTTVPLAPLSAEQESTSQTSSSPEPSAPKITDPVTSLTQKLSDTTDTLLPSF